MTAERAALIRKSIREQIAAVPYVMTPDEMTDQERNGGTMTNEERVAQPGSQFAVCEERLGNLGNAHVDQATACSGLSIHAPTPDQKAAFDKKRQGAFQAALDAQRRAGEALRDKIAAERAQQKK